MIDAKPLAVLKTKIPHPCQGVFGDLSHGFFDFSAACMQFCVCSQECLQLLLYEDIFEHWRPKEAAFQNCFFVLNQL
jgi:hypothetical protein